MIGGLGKDMVLKYVKHVEAEQPHQSSQLNATWLKVKED
jgi:hypothetical protein